jgi:serine protease Do
LLNCDGEIIGINTALLSNNARLGSIGLGFALPARDVGFILQRLLGAPDAAPNWVGLRDQDMTAQLAVIYDRPDIAGAIITAVDPNSPASRAGLQPGDIVTAFNGKPQMGARDLMRSIVVTPSGQPMTLTFWRDGHERDISLTGEPWPHMMALRGDVLASPANIALVQMDGVGVGVKAMTPAEREQAGVPADTGVLIDHVVPGSQAENTDLRPGDIILRTDQGAVHRTEDVNTRLLSDGTTTGHRIALLVQKGGVPRWVTLYVGKLDVAGLLAPLPTAAVGPGARDAAAPAR